MTHKNYAKQAAWILKSQNLSIEEFPLIKKQIINKFLDFYLQNNLKYYKTNTRYLSLAKVEDSLHGYHDMLV